jgi:hypothetical protein
MEYALFYFSDVEGSILMENRNKSEFGLGISDGARFFGDTFKPFLSSYGIILTALILLKIPFRLRRSDTASCYNAPNNQFMEMLNISVKLMALYGSSFPVMLLVQDIAFAIAKKRESEGPKGFETSELAEFMGWTCLLVLVTLSIFALLIISLIVITNIILPMKEKSPDEESGRRDAIPGSTHVTAELEHSLTTLDRTSHGSGPASEDVNEPTEASGVPLHDSTGHVNNIAPAIAVLHSSAGLANKVSGPGTSPENDILRIEDVSQTEDLQSKESRIITKRRKSAQF